MARFRDRDRVDERVGGCLCHRGDVRGLEVLLSPSSGTGAEVVIRTSVAGYSHIWKSVLDRFFSRYDGAALIELNDFGATPGVVMLRLAEAVEVSEGDPA